MNPDQILRTSTRFTMTRISIPKLCSSYESAFASAARRQYGDTSEVIVTVSREMALWLPHLMASL